MGNESEGMKRKSLAEALIALAAFCGLSALSRLFPPVWALVPIGGIAFPLLWAWRRREWARMGFTRRNLGRALLWGLGAGLSLLAIECFTTEHKAAPFFLLQLAVAIPIWLLIMSPFQEFFLGWFINLLTLLGSRPTALAVGIWFRAAFRPRPTPIVVNTPYSLRVRDRG